MRLILIDNYDSFTFNLKHALAALGPQVEVVRNDARSAAEIMAGAYDAIVLSPGPCTPNEAGVCLDLIRLAGGRRPLFGVCLGHQAIGQALGGRVVRTTPMHGKVSIIRHQGSGLFHGINGPIAATRYHSLVVERDTCPADLIIDAESSDGLIMGMRHRQWPLYGVQFHPESIATEQGSRICSNFLERAVAWRPLGEAMPA